MIAFLLRRLLQRKLSRRSTSHPSPHSRALFATVSMHLRPASRYQCSPPPGNVASLLLHRLCLSTNCRAGPPTCWSGAVHVVAGTRLPTPPLCHPQPECIHSLTPPGIAWTEVPTHPPREAPMPAAKPTGCLQTPAGDRQACRYSSSAIHARAAADSAHFTFDPQRLHSHRHQLTVCLLLIA